MISTYVGLAALTARAQAAAVAGVNEAANDLVGRAVQAAPIEEGTLRGSIHTDGAKATAGGAEATVQTGGEASDYSAVQHEGVGFNHPRGGGAKYIERPLMDMAPVYRKHLESAMRKAF